MTLRSISSTLSRAAATVAGALVVCSQPLWGQWISQESGTTQRLRAVCAVNANVVWASGNKGTFCLTTDGGAHWRSSVVPGADTLDFRDVHAVDGRTAYLLSIGFGESARIYKTSDGGKTWQLKLKNDNTRAFIDAFAFWDKNRGIAVGDAVAGRPFIIKTTDGGASWADIPKQNLPPALEGEGAFAASGTCIVTQGRSNVWIGTGAGARSRVFRSTDSGNSWNVSDVPINAGAPTKGIFSLCFTDSQHGVAVGGDYARIQNNVENAAVTTNGGKTWNAGTASHPAGFRSCIVSVPGTTPPTLIAAGPSGSDYSLDGGWTWIKIDTTGFHAISFAGPKDAGWGVGEGGRIMRFAGPVPDVSSTKK